MNGQTVSNCAHAITQRLFLYFDSSNAGPLSPKPFLQTSSNIFPLLLGHIAKNGFALCCGTKENLHSRFVSSNFHPLTVWISALDEWYHIIVHQEKVHGLEWIRVNIANNKGDLGAKLRRKKEKCYNKVEQLANLTKHLTSFELATKSLNFFTM